MNFLRVALCTFLCFARVWSMPTRCAVSKDLMKESHALLEAAGGLFPMQCLKEKVVVAFPQNAFESENADQVAGVERAVYQTLENIDALLESSSDPGQWDTKKWNDFRGLVYRQIEDSRCITSRPEAAQDFPSREASLKGYFETLSSTLKEKDFSFCAWEIVRNEILQTLKFILDHNSDIMS
ncbi:interferon phi 3 [Puntigrus tetrazona]|uniref:interferon phi 3 n=1 Tax=Puntigrus tetrazona TaxID=1606681 RepID=UPI001C8991AB|nr:interferon phi 3 [Puntigrus tetrazona]